MRMGLSERLAHSVSVGRRMILASEVEEVLYGFPQFLFLPYHLVKRKEQPQEKLILRVQRPAADLPESPLKERLVASLRDALGVDAEVEFISKEDERFVVGYKYLKVVPE